MDGAVGQSIDDYASQVAGINQQIDGIVKGGVLPQNDVSYERLKAQRAGIAAKAQALADQTKKAGAAAPDFNAAVKKASSALKTPKEAAPADDAHPLSETVSAIREKYPQYKDVPDDKLIDGIYGKFYKDKMTREEFDEKLADQKPEPSSVLRSLQIGAEAVGRGLANVAGMPFEQANQVLNIPGKVVNTVSGAVTGNDKLVPLLPEDASGTIKQAAGAAEKAVGLPERKLTSGEEVASKGTELATELGPAMGAAPGAYRLAKKGVEKVGELGKTFAGSASRKALEDVRSSALKGTASAESAETTAATEAEKQAAALKAKKAEVASQQPRLAATRADRAAASNPGKPDATLGRKGALTRLQEETAGTEKQLGEAKGATEAAGKEVEAATSRESAAKDAATQLDDDLKSKPGISKEEFGEQLEKTVRETSKRLRKVRSEEADYAGVLERAGDEPRVNTQIVHERIQDIVNKSVRNPTVRKQLEALDRELSNEVGGKAQNALSVRQADSLRKTINEAISKEIYAGDAVSKEAAAHLKEIGKLLTKEATAEGDPLRTAYKEALGKFSTHSRPLEFIEKNPLLRKVVADDPAAAEAAVTRSQIVGKLITAANTQDRKALARLMTESPELRQSARLFFTEDLFGPTGLRDAKSVAQMQTWLKKNKSALDQLGLTKEFKDIKTARDTANKAIADATGTLKQSKKTLEAAAETEKEIQRKLAAREKLRDLASKRVAGKSISELSGGKVPKPAESRPAKAQSQPLGAEEAGKRAGAAQERLGKDSESAAATAEKRQKAAAEYKRLGTEIGAATKEELPGKADAVFKQLAKDGQLTNAQYDKVIRLVDEAKAKIKDTEQLRARVKRIVKSAIYFYAGYKALRTAGEFFN